MPRGFDRVGTSRSSREGIVVRTGASKHPFSPNKIGGIATPNPIRWWTDRQLSCTPAPEAVGGGDGGGGGDERAGGALLHVHADPPTASGVAAVATLSGLMFRVPIPVLGRVASATLVWFLSPLVGVWRVLVKWSWVYQDWLWG